jgi:hypothetical protein
MRPQATDRILDLGSEDGSHIARVVPFRDNVCIADIDADALARGAACFGFATRLLDEDGTLPMQNDEYDIVFCSSVIEHVTIDKTLLTTVTSGRAFQQQAFAHQQRFADEVARVCRRYFVQTPYRYFPIESHTWLPVGLIVLPRAAQLRVVAFTNRHWIKQTQLDFNLLTRRQMQALFPDARIIAERWMGLTKSLIAVRY